MSIKILKGIHFQDFFYGTWINIHFKTWQWPARKTVLTCVISMWICVMICVSQVSCLFVIVDGVFFVCLFVVVVKSLHYLQCIWGTTVNICSVTIAPWPAMVVDQKSASGMIMLLKCALKQSLYSRQYAFGLILPGVNNKFHMVFWWIFGSYFFCSFLYRNELRFFNIYSLFMKIALVCIVLVTCLPLWKVVDGCWILTCRDSS